MTAMEIAIAALDEISTQWCDGECAGIAATALKNMGIKTRNDKGEYVIIDRTVVRALKESPSPCKKCNEPFCDCED